MSRRLNAVPSANLRPILAAGGTPIVFPTDAASANIAAPAAQWTFPGTYTQITASVGSSPVVLCGAVISLQVGFTTLYGSMELNQGAAPEVPFDRFSFGVQCSDSTNDAVIVYNHARLLEPRYLASGTRLSAQQAQSVTSNWKATKIYLYGFVVPNPQVGAKVIDAIQFVQGHAGLGGDRLPTTGWSSNLTHSGTSWTFGAWVEIVASAAEDLMIVGISALANTTNRDWVIELGTGANPNEVALPAQVPVVSPGSTMLAFAADTPLPWPVFVPKGTRIVARHKNSSTNGTIAIALKVAYLK